MSNTTITSLNGLFKEKYMGYFERALENSKETVKMDFSEGFGSAPLQDRLKCKCYRCEKDITPSQVWNYYTNNYRIEMKCHGDTEVKNFTEAQIKKINEEGFWQAFLG